MSTQDLNLPDGRSLRVWVEGDPDGLTVVHHPGTPAGLVPEPELVEAARVAGVALVAVARPGYPGSSRCPGRDVASVAADTAAALGLLGRDAFVCLGWSGGGPHALACAALLPGCRAATSLAGIAPWDAAGLDVLAGMAPDNIEELGAAVAGEPVLRPWLEQAAEAMSGADPAGLIEAMGELLPPVDRAALTGPRAQHFASSTRQALAGGVDGWCDDDLAFVRPWGFDLSDIAVPVAVWQGDEDTMVPATHGRWLAAHLPTARPHLLPGQGHLSLGLDRMTEIVADLVGLAG